MRNPAPPWGSGPEEWRLVEELRLGQIDGIGPEVFGDVHDVAVDEMGHIYVLDYGWKEVRVFDREGRHVRNMARDGEGPGEFRYSGFSPEYRIVCPGVIHGIARDALDVSYVLRLRLESANGALIVSEDCRVRPTPQ